VSGSSLAGEAGMTKLPTILPLRSAISVEELEGHCPGDDVIYACDFHVTGAAEWTPEAGGLRSGRILNVDHHAQLARMDYPVTSTQLAVERVRAAGAAEPGSWVILNHTDCDSVLSSGIILGVLPAGERFVDASVSADHTGEPNDIADLLQALDETRVGDRTVEQYEESMRNLRHLLDGVPLEPSALEAVQTRQRKRSEVDALVERAELRDGLAFAHYEGEIDGALLSARFEDAVVIMLAVPDTRVVGSWVIKLRRGPGAPPGFSLHDLKVTGWDERYGGRANAGSNKRGGGTSMSPEDYAERVRSRLRARFGTPDV
jgi:hypothetical protein